MHDAIMPAFAFWKNSRAEKGEEQLVTGKNTRSNATAATEALGTATEIVHKNLDLDPGNKDCGVFVFDQSSLEPLTLPPRVPLEKAAETACGEVERGSEDVQCDDELVDHLDLAALQETGERDVEDTESLYPAPLTPRRTTSIIATKRDVETSTALTISAPCSNLSSAVYTHEINTLASPSRPTSFTPVDATTPPSPCTSGSPTKAASPQRHDSIVRLRRPADLNLGTHPVSNTCSPRSELEQRHALIRNSKTQSKAALRSPTALLHDRLNLRAPQLDTKTTTTTTTTTTNTTKPRVFAPPQAPENGCWLPGPKAQAQAFTSTSICARTEASQRPAWWCKFDKLVVFDGITTDAQGEPRMRTRTSKGLSVARRGGRLESIVIPLDCAHCQEMLKRHEWKYDMRVCERSVCWECTERCKWEAGEEEKRRTTQTGKHEGNRIRADSVLQE
ncbi:hypothetical protein ACJBU6_04357 [Exserohilum turcicum]